MKKYLVFCFVICFLSSCDTTFTVNAPWRDVTVVYGLLNPNDTIHYVRINKAFLGKVSAYDMAQIRDSSEYNSGDIEVSVVEMENGGWKAAFPLTSYEDTNKSSGTFYSPDQTLYRFEASLNQDRDYTLKIKNNLTGKDVLAETPIVNTGANLRIGDFGMGAQTVSLYSNGNYANPEIVWSSVKNGVRYQLTMRFNYLEKNLDTGVETNKHIDFIYPTKQSSDDDGGDKMLVEINGEEFFKYISQKLEPKSSTNNVLRCIREVDLHLDIAGEYFNTYLEVNEPSTGIVQERPEFTNVFDESGNSHIGIFSTRATESRLGYPLATSSISGNTVTELKSGQYTAGYGFESGACP